MVLIIILMSVSFVLHVIQNFCWFTPSFQLAITENLWNLLKFTLPSKNIPKYPVLHIEWSQ